MSRIYEYFPFDGPCKDVDLVRMQKSDIFVYIYLCLDLFRLSVVKDKLVVCDPCDKIASGTLRNIFKFNVL